MKTMISSWSEVNALPIGLMLLAVLVVFSCARSVLPTPALTPPVMEDAAKPAWQQEWDKTVAEARKEGKAVIVALIPSEASRDMGNFFKLKTGLESEWIAGRPMELVEKFRRERMAGIYTTDLYYGTGNSVISVWKPAGVLAPLSPLLFLPEVVDPKVWYGGKLRFLDTDKMAFSSSLYPFAPLLINTDLVKPGEIKSHKDLLRPRWKANIVMNDPTLAGAGAKWFQGYLQRLGHDFMRELAKQEPIVIRDQRLMVEWIARGKYPILIGPQSAEVADFLRVSSPISYSIPPHEGTYLTGAMGVIAVFDKAPHPKSAQAFVNLFLSKEGQMLNAKLNMSDSARLDINTDFLPPDARRQSGVEYSDPEDEEFLLARPLVIERAKEIFGHLLK